MPDPRLARLADVLVRYSTRVRKGELVKVTGAAVAEPLLVEIYKAVLRAGGHPYLAMQSDEAADAFVNLAGNDQLDYLNPVTQYEIETIDVVISTWGGVNTRSQTNADPGKQARASRARRHWFTTFMKRQAIPEGRKGRLRWVGTMVPPQSGAQDAEMSLREYEDFVFKAGLLHLPNPAAAWRKVSAQQQKVVKFLSGARRVRFHTPQGTDLTVGVAGRKWINCDGKENFPDGEVFTSPIENSTNGVITYTYPACYGGREVENVRLTFKDGVVTDFSAAKNYDFLKKMLEMDEGAKRVGEFAIGTNYHVQTFSKNTLFDEKIGGTCHLAVGNSIYESGGVNQSALHWDMVCELRKGGEIYGDDELIYKDGKFVPGFAD